METLICPEDQKLIEALRNGLPEETREFFYEDLWAMIETIRLKLFQGKPDHNDLVSELYIHLSAGDWRKLDTFTGRGGCRLKSWVSIIAWRFFILRCAQAIPSEAIVDETEVSDEHSSDDSDMQTVMDVRNVLERMPNRRYARILSMLMLEGFSPKETADALGTNTANIYNMKRRAIDQFIKCFDS
ncbi:MAG: hypothetical protein NC039_01330 [Muribaculaceae bacterium]|nr:hypothetical protein [Muribaculaceae bacterium]